MAHSRRFQSWHDTGRVLGMRRDAGATPPAAPVERLRNEQLDRRGRLGWGGPLARLLNPSIMREAGGRERLLERRRRREPRWNENEVAVLRERGDRHVGIARVEVHGLGPDEDQGVALVLERFQCFEEDPARGDREWRVGHAVRQLASLAFIQRMSSRPSSGLRPGPASRSTAT